MKSSEWKPIGWIESDFSQKFGIPRQSGLAESLKARVVFCPEFRIREAFRGLEGFSHLWLIWQFSQNRRDNWSPTVRPPRLGGNRRLGVFATRSPFRPNPIGLSCVRLDHIEWDSPDGPVLHVLGADLLNGTPIYDVKPYLPYADSHPEACGGFASDLPQNLLTVDVPPQLAEKIPADKRQGLVEALAQDPRPSYQNDPKRVYGMAFAGFELKLTVAEKVLRVIDVKPSGEARASKTCPEEHFFHETVENWSDWGRVFQSIPAFEDLVREICRRENLPFSPMRNLTPGTNGVFRVGNAVAKIFFPKESGLDPLPDFQNEAAVCGWLTKQGVPTPRLLAKGSIQDKYEFHYLFTEYSPGLEAGNWLSTAPPLEQRRFVRRLRKLLSQLNRPVGNLIPEIDLLERAVSNPRLDGLPSTLRESMKRRAQSADLSHKVLVHGDLTGENLLVDREGGLTVIDCADACLAPAWYELGPIVFELFQCSPLLLREFAGKERDRFLEEVLDAVSLHDFGADLLREAAKRAGIPIFRDLDSVRNFLQNRMVE